MRDHKMHPARAVRGDMYMTTAELADRWRVTQGHLRNRRVAGRGPRFLSDNGLIRYSVADVEQHEAEHTVTSTSANPDQETR